MASKVYFADLRADYHENLQQKLTRLMKTAGMGDIDFQDKYVAIKLHFGEPGNLAFLRPNWAKTVADFVKERGGKPFLTDCNTLYVGGRKNALDHMDSAMLNGFGPMTTGCQIIIADGLKGNDEVEVPVVGGEYVKNAKIGRAVMDADVFISLTHFKGHEEAGFGGALKNTPAVDLGAIVIKEALNRAGVKPEQVDEVIALHNPDMTKDDVKTRTIQMLEMVGIANKEGVYRMYPHELSGGMRQRVMIAMAMVCKPKLLIADEPTTALDVTIEAQILRLMKELRDETGMSVLIITHNMGVVAEICDYVYVMYAGKIMEQAETFELFDHTMHPYTKGLLDSIPRIGQNAERLHTIPGVVPNLLHLSQGCPFSNRCEYATDQCRTEKAQLHPVAPDHQVRCFRCEEEHQ